MSFRRRLALLCAAAVALAVVLGSVVAYQLVRSTLRGEIDDSLRAAAARAGTAPVGVLAERLESTDALQGPAFSVRLVPPEETGTGVVAAIGPMRLSDRTIEGVHARVLEMQTAPGATLQLARSLAETDVVLGRLRIGLGLIAAIGIALAALLGRLAASAAVRPVVSLTETAEHVADTSDLSRRIEAGKGDDELSRLAASFNTMLAALEQSRSAQRQLVADASHELRTPLTSLRTNLEVLADPGDLDDADRARLRADLVAQIEELTLLVGDLVDLAREEEPPPQEREDLRLDELVTAAVERARRHHPGVEFAVTAAPVVVNGVPARIDRAVANLIDNAAKFGGTAGPVEVTVSQAGEVGVRDHGPGIADADAAHVFDRFWRADTARGRPGSGLGLAIVRQVAETHGGSVAVETPEGGGARLKLALLPSS